MSVDHELREAAAYLSRVAEAGSLALFRLVSERGYVQAAKDVRSGRAPWEVLRATEARRASADPEVDLDAAERNGITLIYPSHALWPHLALSALHAALARTMQLPRPPPAVARAASLRPAETDPASASDVVPPIALWVKGVLTEGNTLDDLAVRSAAIVGSRAATAYGSHVASEFGYALASRDVSVVSGGAFGIDAAAHRGALAAGGKTILVSAGGLDRPYPSAHDTLFDEVAQTGLLVSEGPPGTAPQRHRFLSRNRLIASFGSATVVVEAARRSGALNTARFARQLGRPLLAVPGPVTSTMSVGCHDLLRREAYPAALVTEVADVLALCGSLLPERDPPSTDQLFDPLDGVDSDARLVFDGLPGRGVVDTVAISALSGQPLDVVEAAIPRLVEAGLVLRRPEGYERVATVGRRTGVAS